MTPQALRLVLLVSCAHALVHIYEFTFASVELDVQVEMVQQRLRSSLAPDQLREVLGAVRTSENQRTPAQKEVLAPHESLMRDSIKSIGFLGTAWALPFGLGAVGAGWLADRFGSKRILVTYLIGCGILCLAVAAAPNYGILMAAMFLMGSLASLYHPAGLSLISRTTTARNRGIALGYHGVLGSIGIAGAPLIAGMLLGLVDSWRSVYAVMLVPGVLLGIVLAVRLRNVDELAREASRADGPREDNRWWHFAVYCFVAWLVGVTYRAFTLFLPRYMAEADIGWLQSWFGQSSTRNYLAAMVLVVGIFGQYLSGHLAGRFRLEGLMALVLVAHVPFLFWMGRAEGHIRLPAALGMAFVHFMTQPVGNSLVAKYVSLRRRSFGYGIAFLVSFGAGSLGATMAGYIQKFYSLPLLYPCLAWLLALAALLAVGLYLADLRQRREDTAEGIEP